MDHANLTNASKDPQIVVCIIAHNEAKLIAGAVKSARLLTDAVVVVDSYSDDDTPLISKNEGAVVFQREFDDFSSQRNWALEQIKARYGDTWIMTLDADERISQKLADEIQRRIPASKHDVYLVRIQVRFDRKILRFGGFGHIRLLRLFKSAAGQYAANVNEHLIPNKRASVGRLSEPLLHEDVRSWDRYIDKHNNYSTLEAAARADHSGSGPSPGLLEAIRKPYLRRQWLRRAIWSHLPARPFFRFVQMYLLLGGFLDGRAGFRRAWFAAWQNMCIEAKYDEALRGRTPPRWKEVVERFDPPATDSTSAQGLAVSIVTKNEEEHIADAIRSARQVTNQVFVVDSYSTDSTCEIAAREGAVVVEHPFSGYADQQNWAAEELQRRVDPAWILAIDADERVSPELAREIRKVLSNGRVPHDAYVVKLLLFFDQKPLKWGGFANTKIARLYRPQAGRYEQRTINEHIKLKKGASVGTLEGRLIHEDIRSWHFHIAKHNKIATLEALERKRAREEGKSATLRDAIRKPYLRRRWLREAIFNRLPARPLMRFVQIAFFSGGFLDGRAGLRLAMFHSWVELCIDLKYEELMAEESLSH
jgi:glycosyltransferase involved in cell wall biosynthesis